MSNKISFLELILFISILLGFVAFVCFIMSIFIGSYNRPGEGTRVGYVTNVKISGFVFKTNIVTFQKGNQSYYTNPDQFEYYNVSNSYIFNEIEKNINAGNRVKINYHSNFFTPYWKGDGYPFIDSIEVVVK